MDAQLLGGLLHVAACFLIGFVGFGLGYQLWGLIERRLAPTPNPEAASHGDREPDAPEPVPFEELDWEVRATESGRVERVKVTPQKAEPITLDDLRSICHGAPAPITFTREGGIHEDDPGEEARAAATDRA